MTRLRLAFYGDDFTGSTDVMEALARAGYRTVLFLGPPSPEQLARYPALDAFGIAGGSRTLSPEEMERELPPAFAALKASGAPIAHYKICSTFDSSPALGSIGRAIEIGRRVFGAGPTPLAVGVPVLGRYVAFGTLFARSGLDSEPFRLDRHPTMSRHPVTPMHEADVRLILAGQTTLPVQLVHTVALDAAIDMPRSETTALLPDNHDGIVLFDTVREAHLGLIGGELERLASRAAPCFVVGSSAVEYALVSRWRKEPRAPAPTASVAAAAAMTPPVAVVSGSCSPVTDRQIARALAAGFHEIPLDPGTLIKDGGAPAASIASATERLAGGKSVILHTSRGPADQRVLDSLTAGDRARLGEALGSLLGRLLAAGARRAIVCGGDTSMAAARALGIEALEFAAPIAPGAPLCRVHAPGRIAHGCFITFKGGQNGGDHFLIEARTVIAQAEAAMAEAART